MLLIRLLFNSRLSVKKSFKDFVYLLLERGEGREKDQYMVAFCVPPTGDLACNPGTCPDQKSKQQSFGSQAGTQSADPHHPGINKVFGEPKFTHRFCTAQELVHLTPYCSRVNCISTFKL